MAAADESPNSVLTDPLGPLWYRGLAGPDPDADAERTRVLPATAAARQTVEQELTTVLSAYGARRLIIAHTPILSGIVITNGGRLARIDTGISRYYGGPLSWLEIIGNQMIRIPWGGRRHEVQMDRERFLAARGVCFASSAAADKPSSPRPIRSTSPSSAVMEPDQQPFEQSANLWDAHGAKRTECADHPRIARHHAPHLGYLRLTAARGEFHVSSPTDFPLCRSEEAEARHALQEFRRISAICAARICRIPDVQFDDASQFRVRSPASIIAMQRASRSSPGSAISWKS